MTIGEIIRQKDYEKIVYRLRRHPIIFMKDVFIFLALGSVPPIFYFFAQGALPGFFANETARLLLLILGSVYSLSVILLFFTQFVDYYLDNWVVTNDRILNVEQHALFGRTMSEMDLYKAQDVTSEVKGIFGTLFNYGDVHIQTAAEQERFVFTNVPDPHAIRNKLMNLAEEDRKYHFNAKK